MSTPSTGDKFVSMQTADGKIAAFKLTPATSAGSKFVPVQTADGKTTAMEVQKVTAAGEQGFPVMTADGKTTLMKEKSGGIGMVWTAGAYMHTDMCTGGTRMYGIGAYDPVTDTWSPKCLYDTAPIMDGPIATQYLNYPIKRGIIRKLRVIQGKLMAVGQIGYLGGVAVRGPAVYDDITDTWSALTPYSVGDMYADARVISDIIEYDGDIYIKGNFYDIGGVPMSYVGKWNGASWSTIGTFSREPQCWVVWDGKLVFGFTSSATINSTDYGRVVAYNGSSFAALAATGPDSSVSQIYDILGDGDDIYICGRFTSIGGDTTFRSIAKWNKILAAWDYLDGGVYHATLSFSQAFCLYKHTTGILVGGNYFNRAGTPTITVGHGCAKWNTTTLEWESVFAHADTSSKIGSFARWDAASEDPLLVGQSGGYGLNTENIMLLDLTDGSIGPIGGGEAGIQQSNPNYYAAFADHNGKKWFACGGLVGKYTKHTDGVMLNTADGSWTTFPRVTTNWNYITPQYFSGFGGYGGPLIHDGKIYCQGEGRDSANVLWSGYWFMYDGTDWEIMTDTGGTKYKSGGWSPGAYHLEDDGTFLLYGNRIAFPETIIDQDIQRRDWSVVRFDGTHFTSVAIPQQYNGSAWTDWNSWDMIGKLIKHDGKYFMGANGINSQWTEGSTTYTGLYGAYVDFDAGTWEFVNRYPTNLDGTNGGLMDGLRNVSNVAGTMRFSQPSGGLEGGLQSYSSPFNFTKTCPDAITGSGIYGYGPEMRISPNRWGTVRTRGYAGVSDIIAANLDWTDTEMIADFKFDVSPTGFDYSYGTLCPVAPDRCVLVCECLKQPDGTPFRSSTGMNIFNELTNRWEDWEYGNLNWGYNDYNRTQGGTPVRDWNW